jgi:hypothetical protein
MVKIIAIIIVDAIILIIIRHIIGDIVRQIACCNIIVIINSDIIISSSIGNANAFLTQNAINPFLNQRSLLIELLLKLVIQSHLINTSQFT